MKGVVAYDDVRSDMPVWKQYLEDYIQNLGQIKNDKVAIPGSEQIYNMIASYDYGTGNIDSAHYFYIKEL